MPIDPSTAFVSYAREDLEFVLRLAKDLKAKGAKVWMDKLDIRPGQRWEYEVEAALNGCSRILVIVSPASVASSNVLAEAAFAIDEGKEVIPVLYRECKIPFRLRPFQYSDFRTDYAIGLEELLGALGVEQPPSSVEAQVPKAFGLPATSATTSAETSAAPGASPTVDSDAEARAAEEAQAEQTRLESRDSEAAAESARLEEQHKAVVAGIARLEEQERKRKDAEEKVHQEELERKRLAAEQARLAEERRQADAEKAHMEQQEREQKAEERARQAEMERQPIANQRGRPAQDSTPIFESIGPESARYPAQVKLGIAVAAVVVAGGLLYWALSPSGGQKGKTEKQETQTTQSQAAQPQPTNPQPSGHPASDGSPSGTQTAKAGTETAKPVNPAKSTSKTTKEDASVPAATATGAANAGTSVVPSGTGGGGPAGIINNVPAAVPKTATPKRVRVAQGISQGLLIERVNPVYPPLARSALIQGTVVLQALISKDGSIENLLLVSGHPMLAPAAIDAVKRWKYKPYFLNGEPVEIETTINVNFTLSGG